MIILDTFVTRRGKREMMQTLHIAREITMVCEKTRHSLKSDYIRYVCYKRDHKGQKTACTRQQGTHHVPREGAHERDSPQGTVTNEKKEG